MKHRRLLGGVNALTATAAAATAADHPDAALLTAIAAFWQAHATFYWFSGDYDEGEMSDATEGWYAAIEAVHAIPSKTPAGLLTKARMAHTVFNNTLKEELVDPSNHREEFFAAAVLGEMAQSAT